jgi:hypothetical protein
MIIDFSNPWVFLVWYVITAGLLFLAYKTKKSLICLVPVVYFLIILAITANSYYIEDMAIHRFFNFLGLTAGLCFYIVIDEIETRRKVINQVFKDRYKKNKKKEEDQDESDNSESL